MNGQRTHVRNSLALVTAFLVAHVCVAGQLSVRIVDAPSTVWTYSPVFITATVANHGSDGLLVALNDCCRTNRLILELGLDGEPMQAKDRFSGTQPTDAVVWLKPGAQWLVRLDATPWLVHPGNYKLRIGVVGSDRCVVARDVREHLPINPLGKRPDGGFTFDCWTGAVYSQTLDIASEAAPGQANASALAWLQSDDYPGPRVGRPFLQFSLAYRWLKDRFPSSHYTYVAGLYGNNGSTPAERAALEELLKLQPNHPLTQETRLRLALADLKYKAPINIKAAIHELPAPLATYVRQQWQSMNESPRRSGSQSSGQPNESLQRTPTAAAPHPPTQAAVWVR